MCTDELLLVEREERGVGKERVGRGGVWRGRERGRREEER